MLRFFTWELLAPQFSPMAICVEPSDDEGDATFWNYRAPGTYSAITGVVFLGLLAYLSPFFWYFPDQPHFSRACMCVQYPTWSLLKWVFNGKKARLVLLKLSLCVCVKDEITHSRLKLLSRYQKKKNVFLYKKKKEKKEPKIKREPVS